MKLNMTLASLTHAASRAIVAALLMLAFAPVAFAAPASPSSKQSLTIKADRFEGDLDAEILSVSGRTVVETEDLKITGDKLELNRKTNIARLEGAPARAYAGILQSGSTLDIRTAVWKIGGDAFPGAKIAAFAESAWRAPGRADASTVVAANTITAGLDAGLITAAGGCSILSADENSVMFAQTGRLTAGVSTGGEGAPGEPSRLLWASSRETAKIFRASLSADGSDEFILTAGRFHYDAAASRVEASGTIHIEFEDGELEAESLAGDMPGGGEGGRVSLLGGVNGKIGALELFASEVKIILENAASRAAREKAVAEAQKKKASATDEAKAGDGEARSATVTAGRVEIDLPRRSAELSGGVLLESSDGNRFEASGGWVTFGDDLASVKKIQMENVKIQYNMESGANAPAGGKP